MSFQLRVRNNLNPKVFFEDKAVQLTEGQPFFVGIRGNSAELMVNVGSMHGVVMAIASDKIYPWVTVWGSPTDEMLKDLAYHIERAGGQLFDDVAEIRIEGGFDARTV